MEGENEERLECGHALCLQGCAHIGQRERERNLYKEREKERGRERRKERGRKKEKVRKREIIDGCLGTF
jgi:hypothetical protein